MQWNNLRSSSTQRTVAERQPVCPRRLYEATKEVSWLWVDEERNHGSNQNVYYHCIKPLHPYFKPREVTATPTLARNLTVQNVKLIRRYGIELTFVRIVWKYVAFRAHGAAKTDWNVGVRGILEITSLALVENVIEWRCYSASYASIKVPSDNTKRESNSRCFTYWVVHCTDCCCTMSILDKTD